MNLKDKGVTTISKSFGEEKFQILANDDVITGYPESDAEKLTTKVETLQWLLEGYLNYLSEDKETEERFMWFRSDGIKCRVLKGDATNPWAEGVVRVKLCLEFSPTKDIERDRRI